MRSGIVHHKSDRKPGVIPTADRNTMHDEKEPTHCQQTDRWMWTIKLQQYVNVMQNPGRLKMVYLYVN